MLKFLCLPPQPENELLKVREFTLFVFEVSSFSPYSVHSTESGRGQGDLPCSCLCINTDTCALKGMISENRQDPDHKGMPYKGVGTLSCGQ